MRKLILLAVLSGAAFAVPASSVFPGEVGDSWTFEVTMPWGAVNTETMTVIDKSGAYWRKWDGHPFGTGQTWLAPYQERVYQWQGHLEPVLETDAALNQSFPVSALAMCLDDATFTLVDDDATIDTPAGTFYHCLAYSVSSQCSDAGLTEFVLCPGIGLVQYSSSNIAGPVVAKLASASIGGAVYPKPAGVEVIVQADKAVYDSGDMRIRLELVNSSTETIDITYQSAQRINAELWKNGQQCYSWGAHIRWMLFVNTEQLVPGSPLVYDLSFLAADYVHGTLDGDYELRVYTVGDLQYSGTTTVRFELP